MLVQSNRSRRGTEPSNVSKILLAPVLPTAEMGEEDQQRSSHYVRNRHEWITTGPPPPLLPPTSMVTLMSTSFVPGPAILISSPGLSLSGFGLNVWSALIVIFRTLILAAFAAALEAFFFADFFAAVMTFSSIEIWLKLRTRDRRAPVACRGRGGGRRSCNHSAGPGGHISGPVSDHPGLRTYHSNWRVRRDHLEPRRGRTARESGLGRAYLS